jgi:hypothetical protein
MQIKLPNDSDADERRFSGFHQAKNAWRRLSVLLAGKVFTFLSRYDPHGGFVVCDLAGQDGGEIVELASQRSNGLRWTATLFGAGG